ncbi:MAG: cyclic nucleotide-binding domain-containing protein [Bacteroidia bacterium]
MLDELITRYGLEGSLGAEDRQRLLACTSVVRVRKKTELIREGQSSPWAYVVMKGAIRAWYLQDGIEVSTWFAFEQEIVASLCNWRGLPSRESLQTLEPCVLATLHLPTLKQMVQQSAGIGCFVAAILEEYAFFLEERCWLSQFLPARARYEALLTHEPELFRRVSLTYIASYLGVSRETLSRLRAG